MESFKAKIVFVTGGASGIGASIVEAFRAAGAKVCFCDIIEVCDKYSYQADVRDAVALESIMCDIVERYGDIDIVINNVGVSRFTPLEEISIEEFDDIMTINLRSAFVTSRIFARNRNSVEGRAKYGRIINISSTRHLQSEKGSEAYAASKGALVSLTHALAISFSEYQTTVNSISLGWIDNGKFGTLSQVDHSQHPSGRVGSPSDVARMCLFIADPANDFLNGENLILDGGMTKRMIYEK
ncbi:MAG: SDR family oxidoreductase [Rikenellaceae bacterium]